MNDANSVRKIAITMGEPGGVGPEVIVKSLVRADVRACCYPIVVGNAEIMRKAVKLTGLPLKVKLWSSLSGLRSAPGIIDVMDVTSRIPEKRGVPSKSAGQAFVKYIKKAAELALKRDVDAMVTAPVSKESMKMAGYHWPGHTELLAELTGAKDFAMMFVSDKLKVVLCTIHIPLKDVPKKINKKLVFKTIMNAIKGTAMLGMEHPRIAVSGLNPHAGEAGIMGHEESAAIIPAIEAAQEQGINVSGPFPPDVVFHKALKGGYDMIVCMYHDQGLIPFKMLAFDTGVNVTVGLPIIRTSPDHGTGFDIAWKNIANPSSMTEAIKLASRIKL